LSVTRGKRRRKRHRRCRRRI